MHVFMSSLTLHTVSMSLWVWQPKFKFCECESWHSRQTITVHPELLCGSWKRFEEETSTLHAPRSALNRLSSAFQRAIPPCLSNKKKEKKKKLDLKTHSGSHNCILPRYQLPDVMTDPVVVTLAMEAIDPAVVVVSRGKAAFCLLLQLLLLLCLLPSHPSEESFNER